MDERGAFATRLRQVLVAATFAAVTGSIVCGLPQRSDDLVGTRNLVAVAEQPLSFEKIVYVPIYPTLYGAGSGPGSRSVPMLVTLSLRNVSDRDPVVVSRVEVYDSDGRAIRTLLSGAHALGPMRTADFVVAPPDRGGGSGANFVVTWGAQVEGPDMLVEAVMQGLDGRSGLSFTSRGHVVSQVEHPRPIFAQQ